MKKEEFNKIFHKLSGTGYIRQVPRQYVLFGLFTDDDGVEYEIDKRIMNTIIKHQSGEEMSVTDLMRINNFLDYINLDCAKIDIIIDMDKLMKEVEDGTDKLLEELHSS